jgi:hypothetical protein
MELGQSFSKDLPGGDFWNFLSKTWHSKRCEIFGELNFRWQLLGLLK